MNICDQKILIIGLGSIGSRHLKNIRLIVPDAKVGVLRRSTSKCKNLNCALDKVFFTLDDAIQWSPDIAIVCTPAPCHIDAVISLSNHNVPVFIEKPFASEFSDGQRMADSIREHNIISMCGYVLKFSVPLLCAKEVLDSDEIGKLIYMRAEISQYLPSWRPNTEYRQSVTARKELGGGVLLELSHELDYLLWFGGQVEEVQAVAERLGDLEVDVEDIAEITLKFKSGCMGSIHLDMLRRDPVRRLTIIGTEGTLEVDLLRSEVRKYKATSAIWETIYCNESLDRNDMYLSEMRHFIDCVQSGEMPRFSLESSLETLRLVDACRKSAHTGKRLAV